MDLPQKVSMFTTIVLLIWMDGDPKMDIFVQKPCFSTKSRIPNFSLAFFWLILWIYWFILWVDIISFYIMFCGDEDRKMINCPLIKCTKAWIWISCLSKTWNVLFVTFLFSGKGIPKKCYVQGRVPKLFIFKEGHHPTLISR